MAKQGQLTLFMIVVLLIGASVPFALKLARYRKHKKEQKEKISNHIKMYLERGYSYDTIKQTLTNSGWGGRFIDKCYKNVRE